MDIEEFLDSLSALSDEELTAALQRAEADVRAAQAQRAAVVCAVVDRIEAQGHRLSGATETVAVLTVSSNRSASFQVDASRSVCERPAVWSALAAGEVDLTRARIVSEGLCALEDPLRAEVEQRVLDYARSHTAHQTRKHLLRLLVDLDPALGHEEDERRRRKAWDGRHIGVHAREDGMADIYGCVPLGTAHHFIAALDEHARSYTDERTLEQKRVDALGEILERNVHLDVHVDVVIPADTLAELQETGGSVNGFGPVGGDYVRYLALADDARWRRLVADPVTGNLTDLSSRSYPVPDALRRAVRARDRVCRFPGCSTPARHTDTDHVVPWPRGSTSADNLQALCRTHHRTKTHSGWRCEIDEDARVVWVSPLGSRHQTRAWDYAAPSG